MDDIISYCGYNCSKCPAFKKNIKYPFERKLVSENWYKYCGGNYVEPERINCDGCLKPDSENPARVSKNCKFRSCAVSKRIKNCSCCSKFICTELQRQMSDYKKAYNMFKYSISREVYDKWFLPYDSRKNFGNNAAKIMGKVQINEAGIYRNT